MIPGRLDDIVARKKEEVARAKCDLPLARLRQRITGWPPPRDFSAAVREGTGIIALFQRVSPTSPGDKNDVESFSRDAEGGGASAIAVATEEAFFQGSLEDLERARRQVGLPALRLDVLVEDYQIYESRLWGADAVWLFARLLTPARLKALLVAARSLGLSALVEVRDQKEVAKALKAGAAGFALNLRGYGTPELNPIQAMKLGSTLPGEALKVIAGGGAQRREIEDYRKAGFQGFIVGEHLMRSQSPGEALRKLWSE